MRFSIIVFAVLVLCLGTTSADPPRVQDDGSESQDSRLGELKTLNGHFPFAVPENAGEWHQRAEQLRRRVLVSTGLWPMPEKTPLNAVLFDKTVREGFTVEKVYFESLPGHYVTGLLFRPSTPSQTPMPGVLSPHGHGGRMQKHSDSELSKQIAQGAEHFENSGRTPKLARCVQLARMGCVTFIFDMLGYADSIQISREVAHRHKNSRPEEANTTEQDWVLYSPEADLRLQSVMGLQTWNAIRALDFLESLPDVDPERLAVTGGSGGGTQSILLGAIDDRIKVSFPNGMVSTSMQGGCYCENCNLLRVGTGNVELAALFAPRPQAMTAADDWTKDMMSDGYPELKWLYAMIGDESDVYCRPMLHFKHNYNYVTRATMYQWMNRHLQLGLDDPVVEQDFEPLSDEETIIWGGDHPSPSNVGPAHERSICRWLADQAQSKLSEFLPVDKETSGQFRSIIGAAWQVIFDVRIPSEVTYKETGKLTLKGLDVRTTLVMDPIRKTEIPLVTLRRNETSAKGCVIWTTANGKSDLFDTDGNPSRELQTVLQSGATVLVPDLLGQGELGFELKKDEQRVIDDPRSYSAFTFGYNRTLAAERCGDLLTILAYAKAENLGSVRMIADSGSAPWAAPAAAIAGKAIDRFLIDTAGFRFANLNSYSDANFVPGAVKYGDLPTLLALRAPHRMMLVGEDETPSVVQQSYSAHQADRATLLIRAGFDSEAFSWIVAP
ncbi:MAG: acetylxylan esterase [Rubripirellula sp.]